MIFFLSETKNIARDYWTRGKLIMITIVIILKGTFIIQNDSKIYNFNKLNKKRNCYQCHSQYVAFNVIFEVMMIIGDAIRRF